MPDFQGIFVSLEHGDKPPRQILGNDDGLHCSSCRRETNVDDHECNVCAANWNASGYRLHTGWSPKPWGDEFK